MSTAVRPASGSRRVAARTRDLFVAALAVVIGVGFSAVRVGAGLDRAGVAPQLIAFAVLGACAIVLLAVSDLRARDLGLRMPQRAGAIVCPLLALVAFTGVLALTRTATGPDPHSVLVALVFYAGAVAPAEELLFRGVLFAAVERTAGPIAAVVVSAAAFAVAHLPVYGPGALPLMLAGGLVLGWCRAWSRSLAAPVAVHALADLAVLWA